MTTPPADTSPAAVPVDPGTAQVSLTALRALGDQVAGLVDVIDETRWRAATPCPDLDVDHLVRHLVGGLQAFTGVARGGSMAGFGEPELDLGAAAVTYRKAIDDAVEAWSGAGRLDRSYDMPWGATPGLGLLGFLLVEQAGHGWDLARALGRRGIPDGEGVTVADAVARTMLGPEMRTPGMFGPEVPAPSDAEPIDRLAAFLGRRP